MNPNVLKENNLLLVFVKSPEKGKVKTRLAKTIGDDKALHVYLKLLDMTFSTVHKLPFNKAIFYSGFTSPVKNGEHNFLRFVQYGKDLGEKMQNAFEIAFCANYSKAVIIGSDCPELSPAIIDEAFRRLNYNDVVIGPAEDGGYYLLGMKKVHQQLFQDKNWSTNSLLAETVESIENSGLSYHLLQTLSDVDVEADLKKFPALDLP